VLPRLCGCNSGLGCCPVCVGVTVVSGVVPFGCPVCVIVAWGAVQFVCVNVTVVWVPNYNVLSVPCLQLKESNPFFHGDSSQPGMHSKLTQFCDKIGDIAEGRLKGYHFILDDPAGNSFIQVSVLWLHSVQRFD
jgi:hypothetical protein